MAAEFTITRRMDSNITNKINIKMISRARFNAAWWLATVIAAALIVALTPLGGKWPLPAAFWYGVLICLAAQAVVYYLILARMYPDRRQGNRWWTLAIPLLILIGIWLAVLAETAARAWLGRLN